MSTTTKPEIIPFDELVRVDRLVQDQPGISFDELVEATDIPRQRARLILIRLEARGRVRRRQDTSEPSTAGRSPAGQGADPRLDRPAQPAVEGGGEDQFEPVAGGAA